MVISRFNLEENEEIVLQRFVSNKIVDSDVFGSNVNLRVDGEDICTGVIGIHSDRSREMAISKALKEPSDMAGTIRHSNKFSFRSGFCDGGLLLREPQDKTVIE